MSDGQEPGAPGSMDEFRRGWPVLVLGFIGIYCMNLLTYPTSVLVKPIGEAWGWSRAETTALVSFASVITLLVGPWVGTMLRRVGAIRTALGGSLGMAVGMVAIGHAGPSLPLWYAAWTFFAIAQQFGTVIVWSYAASVLFVRHRGLALSIVISASALAAATMPAMTLWLHARFGIGGAYTAYGAMVLVLNLPLLFVRLPLLDGKAKTSAREGPAPADLTGLSLRQAVRTRRFWLLTPGLMVVAGVVASVVFHAHALMTDAGLSLATATWVMSLLGPALLVGRLATGVLLDHLPAWGISLLVVISPLVTCLIFATFTGSVALAAVAVVCCGFAAGAEGDVLAYFAGRHFGLAHYGAIYGLMLGLFGIGFGSFPPLAGHVFDLTGSYAAAFGVFGVLLVGAAALLLAAGDYPPEYGRDRH